MKMLKEKKQFSEVGGVGVDDSSIGHAHENNPHPLFS